MPLIQVTMIEGRTPEKKEKLIEELSYTAMKVLDAPLESVRVCINEIPNTHWGIAGKSVYRRQNEE
ncbi:MAG TPA: 2-hydroxymuconate tautomerase family protein [Rummeliibacillus sp.]|nr:2-hydroxymuconate tautomerase family protein [Rummeliibacillus sp.]